MVVGQKMCWSKSDLYNSLDVLGARSLLLIIFLPGVQQNGCFQILAYYAGINEIKYCCKALKHWTDQ